MSISEYAGCAVPDSLLEDIPSLLDAYYSEHPDVDTPEQRVSFGTSGHRGTSRHATFTEDHILAITQAICELRRQRGIQGPLFLGKDTHALSRVAERTALEVLAANDIEVRFAGEDAFTPTPVISHAILRWNQHHPDSEADGIVVTPSHNPASDGGFKYNPPSGGPADADITRSIETRANDILRDLGQVARLPYATALTRETIRIHDFVTPYVDALPEVIDLDAIRRSELRLGADALGGAGLAYWAVIAERFGLDITPFNTTPDPTFRFMRVDHDGKVRMDCSSPYAMAGLIELKDRFDIAFGNDPDFDRHGIVTPTGGLMNPNHFLAAAVDYLLQTRQAWNPSLRVAKTVVTTAIIERIATAHGRQILDVPVGFKWFADGLLRETLAFAGEESAGASFLTRCGTVWTTDKDGIILALLAAEMTATTGEDPAVRYRRLTERFGAPVYRRIDAPADRRQKRVLQALNADTITARTLAGEAIVEVLTTAPGNGAPLGGLKVQTENGWFAARPSGTENIYKLYAESFRGTDHLDSLLAEARQIVDQAFAAATG